LRVHIVSLLFEVPGAGRGIADKLLRHSDVATTLGIYAHSMSEDGLAAQDDMLAAMMPKSNAVN